MDGVLLFALQTRLLRRWREEQRRSSLYVPHFATTVTCSAVAARIARREERACWDERAMSTDAGKAAEGALMVTLCRRQTGPFIKV